MCCHIKSIIHSLLSRLELDVQQLKFQVQQLVTKNQQLKSTVKNQQVQIDLLHNSSTNNKKEKVDRKSSNDGLAFDSVIAAGKADPVKKPTSCGDLFLYGHSLPGFYMVKVEDEIKTLFCDFQVGFGRPGKNNTFIVESIS